MIFIDLFLLFQLESILGLSWNILVIVVMTHDSTANETSETLLSPELTNETDVSNFTETIAVAHSPDYNSLWQNLTEKLKTDPYIEDQRKSTFLCLYT